jgi:hypothetical protein
VVLRCLDPWCRERLDTWSHGVTLHFWACRWFTPDALSPTTVCTLQEGLAALYQREGIVLPAKDPRPEFTERESLHFPGLEYACQERDPVRPAVRPRSPVRIPLYCGLRPHSFLGRVVVRRIPGFRSLSSSILGLRQEWLESRCRTPFKFRPVRGTNFRPPRAAIHLLSPPPVPDRAGSFAPRAHA